MLIYFKLLTAKILYNKKRSVIISSDFGGSSIQYVINHIMYAISKLYANMQNAFKYHNVGQRCSVYTIQSEKAVLNDYKFII